MTPESIEPHDIIEKAFTFQAVLDKYFDGKPDQSVGRRIDSGGYGGLFTA